MSFPTEWRNPLLVCGAAFLAIFGAVQISDGSPVFAVFFCIVILALVLSRIQPIPIETLVLGVVMTGYIVGNRGFAQLSLVGSSPFLPAELALVVSVGAISLKCAAQRELPFQRDPLNAMVLLWIVIGTIRVAFDFKSYGFVAIRDYAMVYYATFFFIAQQLARDAGSRKFLVRCIYFAGVTLLLLQPFYTHFPDFFLQRLTIRNAPLIYYKGDLLTTFLAITALVYFLRFEESKRFVPLVISIFALWPVLATNNRASLLGLLIATGFLVSGRRWKFAMLQISGGALAIVLIILLAWAKGKTWESTPVFELYERVISVADPFGKQSYKGADTSYKGANNTFRTVWWELVIDETVEKNPWVGLGFGYDLSARFLERYYPTSDDDFTVRSPHNILVTVFSRMGIVGLLPFLAIAALMVQGCLRAVRQQRDENDAPSLWCSAWIIFTSACFGIVLEGPMGAVVFWTVLGLAHHSLSARETETKSEQQLLDTPLLNDQA